MDSNNGGQPLDNDHQLSAAEAAREKILAVYNSAMQSLKKYPEQSSNSNDLLTPPVPGNIYEPDQPAGNFEISDQEPIISEASDFVDDDTYTAPEDAPYYDSTDETSSLKDVPINQSAVNTEWQQYHSAWQNYYQNYYSDYYAKAAQNYLETEKLKNERIASGEVHKKHRSRRLIPLFIVILIILGALFVQYNRLIFAPIMAYVVPDADSVSTSIEAVDPNITQAVSPEPRLIIPKLNIDVPVAFGIGYNEVMSAMNHGVAQFMVPGADAMPGEAGNLVLSGHSAGDIYSQNPYKFIFSGLERLEPGDLIYVNYNSVRYTYTMSSSKVVEPSDVAALMLGDESPMLTLITCTPLGTSRYRLLIMADQISPEYVATTTPPPTEGDLPVIDQPPENTENSGSTNSESDLSMPANEPSFLEKLWNSLFGGGN